MLHLIAPHAGEPAPGPLITLNMPGLFRPPLFLIMGNADAAQARHGRHWDSALAGVFVLGAGFGGPPPPNAGVITRGKHTSDRPCKKKFRYQNPTNLMVSTQMWHRDPAGNIVPGQSTQPHRVLPNTIETELLPMELTGMPLTGITMIAQGPGQSTTTMAYLGSVNGQRTQMNLGVASYLFSEYAANSVPFFFNEGQDLHIAVNLGRLAAANAHFQLGAHFNFQNGECADLPGILASRVPIHFDPNQGFQSPVPYTGPLMVLGELSTGLAPAITGTVTYGTELPPVLLNEVMTVKLHNLNDPNSHYDHIVALAADGSYAIEGVPPGNYELWVKSDKTLAQRVPVSLPQIFPDHPAVTNMNFTLTPGDGNNDNLVDVLDVHTLIAAFDATPEDPNYNANTDFDGNGVVDVFDLSDIIRHFDEEGAPDIDD